MGSAQGMCISACFIARRAMSCIFSWAHGEFQDSGVVAWGSAVPDRASTQRVRAFRFDGVPRSPDSSCVLCFSSGPSGPPAIVCR
eukprot:4466078-Pyramimonas_sp.AAC.1